MPAKALPLSLEAAFDMKLAQFICALDEDDSSSTADAVVAILEAQQVRSTRRLASTPVRYLAPLYSSLLMV